MSRFIPFLIGLSGSLFTRTALLVVLGGMDYVGACVLWKFPVRSGTRGLTMIWER